MDKNQIKGLTVVIPAYNEEGCLEKTITQVINHLEDKPWPAEIIVVNDGSQDNTGRISLPHPKGAVKNIEMISHPQNRGKGAAIKTGIHNANQDYNYVLFMDADSSTPITEIDKFIPHLTSETILIGSRKIPGANIKVHQPWYRRLIGNLGNLLIQTLLTPGIRDTQCGFKIMPTKKARSLIAESKVNGWGLDFELIFLAQRKNLAIKEIPVEWFNSVDSKVKVFPDIIKTLRELIQIRLRNLIK